MAQLLMALVTVELVLLLSAMTLSSSSGMLPLTPEAVPSTQRKLLSVKSTDYVPSGVLWVTSHKRYQLIYAGSLTVAAMSDSQNGHEC